MLNSTLYLIYSSRAPTYVQNLFCHNILLCILNICWECNWFNLQVSPTKMFTLWLKAKTFFRSYFLILTSFYVLFVGAEIVPSLIHSQRHTRSVRLLWTRDRPVAETSLWQHTTLTRDISVPSAGFDPAIAASEPLQFHPLDDVVIGIGLHDFITYITLHATDSYHLL